MIKQRLENEFTSEEMESWAQEVRTAMKESPDENEEVFPNDAVQLRDYILTLEENMKDKPTDQLREELRTYKAYQTGWWKGVCFTYEYFIDLKEKERVREREEEEEEIKPTMFDGGPMFETEEDFQKMKKVLADDPNTLKGHWVEDGQYKKYIFDEPIVDDEPKRKKRKKRKKTD